MQPISQKNNKIIKVANFETAEWYRLFIEECHATVVESVVASRWALVEGYWKLGELIRNNEIVNKYFKGNTEFLATVAKNIGTSARTIYYALQAYDKYPDINTLPEGKNISWKKLITKYLPQPNGKVEEVELEMQAGFCQCPKCGYVFKPVIQTEVKPLQVTSKKYSSITNITEEDMQDVAQAYKVSLGFVKLQLETLRNYCESKGRVYKNYKAALRNFVLGDMKRSVERRIPDASKRAVDARQVG